MLGVDPWRDGAQLRPQIGVMLQDGGLYPGIRRSRLSTSSPPYYDDPDDPERLLHLVGLEDAADTLVRRMSGGQQQRLSLALALVGRPTSCSSTSRPRAWTRMRVATTWTLIRELRDGGATVVLTTHAMDEAEHLCDRVGDRPPRPPRRVRIPVELTTDAAADETTFSAATGLAVEQLAHALGLRRHGA